MRKSIIISIFIIITTLSCETEPEYNIQFFNNSEYILFVTIDNIQSFYLNPGEMTSVKYDSTYIFFTTNNDQWVTYIRSAEGNITFRNKTTLTITNGLSEDIFLVKWNNQFFGDELVYSSTTGNWYDGIKVNSNYKRTIEPGSSKITFFKSSGGFFETTIIITVTRYEQATYTIY
jgi:hypothetical protein